MVREKLQSAVSKLRNAAKIYYTGQLKTGETYVHEKDLPPVFHTFDKEFAEALASLPEWVSDLDDARVALASLRLGGLGEQDYIAADILKRLKQKYGPLPKEKMALLPPTVKEEA